MTLRDLVFEELCNDAALTALGFKRDNIWPLMSRDSPPETIEGGKFMVLRWGTKEIGVGRVIPQLLDVWAYNKSEPFYTDLEDGLKRVRLVLAGLETRAIDLAASGHVVGVEWQGAGPDGFDEGYRAYYLSENYRITASGS